MRHQSLLWKSPESAQFLGHLHFAVYLVAGRKHHEHISNQEVVIYRVDNHGVSAPDQACRKDSYLLVRRDELRWLLKVPDVTESYHPLERWGPEKY